MADAGAATSQPTTGNTVEKTNGENPQQPKPSSQSGPTPKTSSEKTADAAGKFHQEITPQLKTYFMIITAGILLVAAGSLFAHIFDAVQERPQPYWDEYDDNNDGRLDDNAEYYNDLEVYDTFRTLDRLFTKIGIFLAIPGVILTLLGILRVSLYADTLDGRVKLGLLVFGGLVVVAVAAAMF